MKLVILALLFLPSYVLGTGRRGIGYHVIQPPAHRAAASVARNADSAPPIAHSNSTTVPMGWSRFLDPAAWISDLSDAYKGFLGSKFWGETRLRRSASVSNTEVPLEASDSHNIIQHMRSPTFLVSLQDLGTTTYKYILAMVSPSAHSNATMLHAHEAKASSSPNAENLQPKTSEVVAGTLASAGGHRMTLHKGLEVIEDTGFGASRSLLTWEVIACITLYAFIGTNTASFVARVFQWPWLTSMLVNVFIWPVLTLGALVILIFCRSLALRQAKKYFGPVQRTKNVEEDQTSALLAVDEAWCAYHVAHASHDLCVAKINDKHGVNEVVTPESLGKESRTSEKGALRWYRWLLGSTSELTVGAVHVKTAELHCADASKICNTLFAIYHEDGHDTLSITDALSVLQGWAAGKYGASHVQSADMNYLINTLLAVLLSKCKCGSVNKADWMKLADVYPEFFDVEPQYPQHVRYLRLMDSIRTEAYPDWMNPATRGGQQAP